MKDLPLLGDSDVQLKDFEKFHAAFEDSGLTDIREYKKIYDLNIEAGKISKRKSMDDKAEATLLRAELQAQGVTSEEFLENAESMR